MNESDKFARNLTVRPSIFEISASEILDKSLQSALCHIFKWMGMQGVTTNLTCSRQATVILNKYYNEISLGITAAIQYMHLKKHGASFGEKFYGLERKAKTANFVIKNYKLFSAATLVILPYVEEKLTLLQNQQSFSRAKLISNYIFSTFKITKSIFTLLYLSHKLEFYSFLNWFTKTSLTFNLNFNNNDFISHILEVVAFFFQFLQWWQTTHIYTIINKCVLSSMQNHTKNDVKCPICYQIFDIPIANSVTGYVYCWKCIILYLKNNKYCPVTNIPTDVDDLIRIYEKI